MTSVYRTGIGYDIHRLVEDRPLIIGGLRIEHDKGLLGHSDADVVLHAVTDALLGAAGLGDIGDLFPDTDPAYKDIDSKILLTKVMEKLTAADYAPTNLDIIIHAEVPKMSPHKKNIAASIAKLTGLPATHVSVKAKTNEGVGPVGQTQAIACTAVVMIQTTHQQ